MKTKPTRILNKLYVCNCGCHGSDPWHKSWYTRVITLDDGSTTSGTVRLPFSTQPVRVTYKLGLWQVERDSISYDK